MHILMYSYMCLNYQLLFLINLYERKELPQRAWCSSPCRHIEVHLFLMDSLKTLEYSLANILQIIHMLLTGYKLCAYRTTAVHYFFYICMDIPIYRNIFINKIYSLWCIYICRYILFWYRNEELYITFWYRNLYSCLMFNLISRYSLI